MESKVKEAVQRKMCGYNCAQAVACTYCEQYKNKVVCGLDFGKLYEEFPRL